MDFGHYSDLAVLATADLVNSLDVVSGEDVLTTPAQARDFLVERNFTVKGELSGKDLEELRAVRERLRAVFFASDATAAAGLINELLSELAANPFLTDHDGHWHLHYTPDDAPLSQRVGATMSMGLATVIAEHGFERLGICTADECKDVFVDTSRNRSRRYCSDSCSSRMNVAAFRARRKADKPAERS